MAIYNFFFSEHFLSMQKKMLRCPALLTAAAAKSLQSCPTLCDPIVCSPPGSPVPGILQARTLEWVAISFSNAWKLKVKGKSLSRARLFATPWTAAYQDLPSMGFSRQEYWSGVPLPYSLTLHNCPVGFPSNIRNIVEVEQINYLKTLLSSLNEWGGKSKLTF